MSTFVISDWHDIKNDVIAWNEKLGALFENLKEEEEEITEELKDALRFSTYLRALIFLRNYPVQLSEACVKGKEIVQIFTDSDGEYDNVKISELRMKIMAFEEAFSGDDGIAPADYIMGTLNQPDPADEDDDYWIINLFQFDLPSVA